MIHAFVKNMYYQEGCGICQKPGADVFYFTDFSRCAHQKCYDIVKKYEDEVMKIAETCLKENSVKECNMNGVLNNFHISLIRDLKMELSGEINTKLSLLDLIKNKTDEEIRKYYNKACKDKFDYVYSKALKFREL